MSDTSEYTGEFGPAGVPALKPLSRMRAPDKAQLLKLTGTTNPQAPVDRNVWLGLDSARLDRLNQTLDQ